MSFEWSDIRWGRVVIGVILALIVSIVGVVVVQVIAVTARGFQLRGAPPREEQIAIVMGAPVQVLGLVMTALGGLLGGRSAARRAEAGWQPNGLGVGVIAAVLRAAYAVTSIGRFSIWALLHFVTALAGGWFGGWLAERGAQAER